MLKVGDGYSLVRKRDVECRKVVSVEHLPQYLAYEDLFDGIHQCHVELDGHLGIQRTEKVAQQHFVNFHALLFKNLLQAVPANWTKSFQQNQKTSNPS